MIKYKYTISGLNSSFDGLDIEVNEKTDNATSEYLQILSMRDRNIMLGDRNLSIHLPKDALLIHIDFLKKCLMPETIEFASNNVYGNHLSEFKFKEDDTELVCVLFENCVQISIMEIYDDKKKTLYSENFFVNEPGIIFDFVLDEVKNCSLVELIFRLNDKAWETNEEER